MLVLPAATRPVSATPYVILLIAVTASEPWRRGTYFTGSFDSVVVIKAILSMVALGLALVLTRGRPKHPIGAGIPVALALYVVATTFGGWADGNLLASGVVSVRVLILLGIVTVLATTYDNYSMMVGLVGAVATVGAFAVLTAAGLEEGRLAGGLPPLHPNEIAAIAGICALWLLGRVVTARDTPLDLLLLVVALAALVATQSRTSLFVLLPAAGLVFLLGRRYRISVLVAALVALPMAVVWVVQGSVVAALLTRGGSASDNLLTLSNRTVAWTSALAPKSSPWSTWLGGGLSVKQIEVEGQGWTHQILDSSWVSALVQGGFVGLALVALVAIGAGVKSLRSDPDFRGFRFGLVAFLTVRGFLESGLFDASTAFLAFAVVAIIPTDRGPTLTHGAGPDPDAIPAVIEDSTINTTGQGMTMPNSRLRWRAALNCLALAVVAAGLFNFFAPREYEASTSLYATAAGAQTRPTDVYQGTLMVEARMDTYTRLASSSVVTSKVVEDLSLDESPSALAERITVTHPEDTAMITITARDSDPGQAQQLAAAMAGRFAETVGSIETSDRAAAQVKFSVVQPAAAPIDAAAPRQLVNIAYGAGVGALVGLVVLLWPFVRFATSPNGQLRVVFLGPLADRIPVRAPAPVPSVTAPPATAPLAITPTTNGAHSAQQKEISNA